MTWLALGGLLGAGAIFAGAIGWELSGSPDMASPVVTSSPTVNVPASPVPPERDQTREWIATVLARPLFSPTRRPPAESREASSTVSGLPRLAGIIVGPSGRSAIFAGEPRPVVVPEGGRINGYIVSSIDAAEVKVAGPEGLLTIHPSFQPAPPRGPSQAPRPGQPVKPR